MQGSAPSSGYGPPTNVAHEAPRRRGSWIAVSLAALAVVLATAALIVSLVRKPEAPTQQAAAPIATAAPIQQELFVEDADRALCGAITPLMKEVGEQNRAFAKLAPGSPEQGAAIPDYRSFINEWAKRMQTVLNTHADPPRYLTRTLQAYIDDKLLYVELVRPGYIDPFDRDTWNQASIDVGGPLATCRDLGITWE